MKELLKSIFSNQKLTRGILESGGDRQAIAKLIEAAGLSMDEEKLGQLTEFAVVWKKQQDGEELSEAEAALLPDAAETELVGKLFKDAEFRQRVLAEGFSWQLLAEMTAKFSVKLDGTQLDELCVWLPDALVYAGLGPVSPDQLQAVAGGQQKAFYEDPFVYDEEDDAGLNALPAIAVAIAVRQIAKTVGKSMQSATAAMTQAVAAQR